MSNFNTGKFVVAIQFPFNAVVQGTDDEGGTIKIAKGDWIVKDKDNGNVSIVAETAFKERYSQSVENQYRLIEYEDPTVPAEYKKHFGRFATHHDVSALNYIIDQAAYTSIAEVPEDVLAGMVQKAKGAITSGYE